MILRYSDSFVWNIFFLEIWLNQTLTLLWYLKWQKEYKNANANILETKKKSSSLVFLECSQIKSYNWIYIKPFLMINDVHEITGTKWVIKKDFNKYKEKWSKKSNLGCHLPLLGRPSRRSCVRIHYSRQLPSVNGTEWDAMFYLK